MFKQLFATDLDDKPIREKRKTFFINQKFEIDISNEEANQNMLIAGTSGGGKTTLLFGLCSQMKAGLYLDSKGKGYEKLLRFGFRDWEYFDCDKQPLQINASELNESALVVLQDKNTEKEKRMLEVLRNFCHKPKKLKKWVVLENMLLQNRYYDLARDLGTIFSKKDSGISISDLTNKKICWNVRGLSLFHSGVGLLIKILYDYTYAHNAGQRYFIAADDAQTGATGKTALGKAMAMSFSEGREMQVSSIISGTHLSFVAYGCKTNAAVLFFFKNDKKKQEYYRNGIDFEDFRMKRLVDENPSGGNFFVQTDLPCIINGRAVSIDSPFPVHFALFEYLNRAERERNQTDAPNITQDFLNY